MLDDILQTHPEARVYVDACKIQQCTDLKDADVDRLYTIPPALNERRGWVPESTLEVLTEKSMQDIFQEARFNPAIRKLANKIYIIPFFEEIIRNKLNKGVTDLARAKATNKTVAQAILQDASIKLPLGIITSFQPILSQLRGFSYEDTKLDRTITKFERGYANLLRAVLSPFGKKVADDEHSRKKKLLEDADEHYLAGTSRKKTRQWMKKKLHKKEFIQEYLTTEREKQYSGLDSGHERRYFIEGNTNSLFNYNDCDLLATAFLDAGVSGKDVVLYTADKDLLNGAKELSTHTGTHKEGSNLTVIRETPHGIEEVVVTVPTDLVAFNETFAPRAKVPTQYKARRPEAPPLVRASIATAIAAYILPTEATIIQGAYALTQSFMERPELFDAFKELFMEQNPFVKITSVVTPLVLAHIGYLGLRSAHIAYKETGRGLSEGITNSLERTTKYGKDLTHYVKNIFK